MENQKISILKEYINRRIKSLNEELAENKNSKNISIEYYKFEKGLITGGLSELETILEIIEED